MAASDRFEVGVVAGAHGLSGALRIQLFDAASSAVAPGRVVVFRAPTSETRVTITVRRSAAIPGKVGQWRVESDDVRGRDAAEALVGSVIEVERRNVAPAADDEFFLADAVGLPVMRARPGSDPIAMGTIIAVTSNGAQDLFEVRYRSADGRTRTWLLPVLPHVIRDVTTDAVWVDPPLGIVPEEFEDGV